VSHRSVVIVPVERATDVARVVRVATVIAASPADVHLVQVMPADGRWRMEQDWRGPAEWLHGSEMPTASRVSAVARAAAGEGAAVRTVRVRGTAESIIPAYAQLVGARAVVVERDYGTPRIWRSSAVVRRLSRSSQVPVLVLPAHGPALDRVARGDISRVVVAVDTTVGSTVALSTGAALARQHDARLMMVHAIHNVSGRMVFSGSEAWRVMERLAARQRQIADQLRQRAPWADANAQAQVVAGDPGPAIVRAASEADSDLVVMGVAPRSAFDEWVFGSTLSTVLRRAQTPVLVVRVTGGDQQWHADTFGEDANRALAGRWHPAPASA
jgi:nucleotide-binding universal stress UspA family protein